MNWAGYEHYQPEVLGQPGEMSRKLAAKEFDHLMESRPQRRAALASLLSNNGIILTDSDYSIAKVNSWFVENITPFDENPKRPAPMWYSVIKDLSLFLGDIIIDRNDGLSWDMATWGGQRNPSYQRHVVAGFPPEGMNIIFDTDLRLAAYGMAVIRGDAIERDKFTGLLHIAASMATTSY